MSEKTFQTNLYGQFVKKLSKLSGLRMYWLLESLDSSIRHIKENSFLPVFQSLSHLSSPQND